MPISAVIITGQRMLVLIRDDNADRDCTRITQEGTSQSLE